MLRLRPISPRTANAARNALGGPSRRRRWEPARDALWELVDRHLTRGASVGIVGAGNTDDLPLTRILARAGQVDLLDIDAAACRRALVAYSPALRARGRVRRVDVTAGAAGRVTSAAWRGREPRAALPKPAALGTSRYDVVIGDLLYTQTLYPALHDSGLPQHRVDEVLDRWGPPLADLVVGRLHASAAPDGTVIHVHDVLGWWKGHQQPFAMDDVLAVAARDVAGALRMVAAADGPHGSDVASALRRRAATVRATALWRWSFQPGVDYLVAAFVADAGR